MRNNRTAQSAKRWMFIGMLVLIIGGVVLLVLSIAAEEAYGVSAVAWGSGAGTAIYYSAKRAITALESHIASSNQTGA